MSEKIPDGYDVSAWFDDDAGVSISALVDLKATARSEGYRAGLEAAAKECESIATGAAMVDARFDSDFAAQVAAAIRALMGKDAQGGREGR
jgi:hypothetical protein